MEDSEIINLYWIRSEDAIVETERKYGSYCRSIARNILSFREDTEECVNDTYLKVWNTVPPERPRFFQGFLAKITRNLALSRYRRDHAEKRGGGQVPLALEELEECIPHPDHPERMLDNMMLAGVLNAFLTGLKPEARKFFIQRYWYLLPVKKIASLSRVTESKVKMSLQRSRKALKEHLEKEGIEL